MRVHCIAGLVCEERNQRPDGAAGFILRRWLEEEWLLGAGCGGGSIDKGFTEILGVVWCDYCVEWLTAEWRPEGDASISTSGNSKSGIAMEEGGSKTG